MGSIISQEPSISNLTFRALKKGQVQKDCEVLKVDADVALVKLKNGGFWLIGPSVRHLNHNVAISSFGLHGASRVVLDGLVRIGAVKREEADKHLATVKEHVRQRREKQAASDLGRMVEDLGGADHVRDMLDATYGERADG